MRVSRATTPATMMVIKEEEEMDQVGQAPRGPGEIKAHQHQAVVSPQVVACSCQVPHGAEDVVREVVARLVLRDPGHLQDTCQILVVVLVTRQGKMTRRHSRCPFKMWMLLQRSSMEFRPLGLLGLA